MSSFNQTPDKPQSFGYKTSWFALKTSDLPSVIDALDLGEATPANWASGLAATYLDEDWQRSNPWLFVSPSVRGWILAVSSWLPYPTDIEAHHHIGRKFDALFSRLMGRFDDVQFFASHRVSDFAAWARALNGEPMRLFAYADGQVSMNVGSQTLEEAKLGFADLTGLSPIDAGDEIFRIADEQSAAENALVASGFSRREAQARVRQNGRDPFPNENDVIGLASLWSVDPTQLSDQDHPLGLGLAVRLPRNFMQ